MTKLLYTFSIYIYKTVITIASIFHKKAKFKIQGIKESKRKIEDFVASNSEDIVLIHCASQGEHEQAQPIIRWMLQHSFYNIVLSFYSSSGYRNVNYNDEPRIHKTYLPFDTPVEMSNFVSHLNPKIAIIIKNEWWWNLLYELNSQKVATYLVSATIRKSHYFLKYSNSFFVNGLNAFSTVFVIDEASSQNLSKVFKGKICIAKDTRIDQVNYLKNKLVSEAKIQPKKKLGSTIVYGSIWESDLESIIELINLYPEASHLIYPHELEDGNIKSIKHALRASKLINNTQDHDQGIHIITAMGELKSAYSLATMAYIGGGFGVGIHNVLEAAVYNIPTIFGPNYRKSNEAKYLVAQNCSYTFSRSSELKEICNEITKETNRNEIETKLKSYFSPKFSPTEIICQEIFMKKAINV